MEEADGKRKRSLKTLLWNFDRLKLDCEAFYEFLHGISVVFQEENRFFCKFFYGPRIAGHFHKTFLKNFQEKKVSEISNFHFSSL